MDGHDHEDSDHDGLEDGSNQSNTDEEVESEVNAGVVHFSVGEKILMHMHYVHCHNSLEHICNIFSWLLQSNIWK